MLTKEQILCGTIEELVGYFELNYNPTLSSDVGNPLKDAERRRQHPAILDYYFYTPDLGSVAHQLKRCTKTDNSTGMVFLFASHQSTSEIPEVTMEILKFWVFVRAPKTDDATSAS